MKNNKGFIDSETIGKMLAAWTVILIVISVTVGIGLWEFIKWLWRHLNITVLWQ